MQNQVRNTCFNQQSATYLTIPKSAKHILLTNKLPVAIYRPIQKGWITWLARAHVNVHNLLRVTTRRQFQPDTSEIAVSCVPMQTNL